MYTRRLQKLGETYAGESDRYPGGTRGTEAVIPGHGRARLFVLYVRSARRALCILARRYLLSQPGIFSQMRRLEQTPLRLSIKTTLWCELPCTPLWSQPLSSNPSHSSCSSLALLAPSVPRFLPLFPRYDTGCPSFTRVFESLLFPSRSLLHRPKSPTIGYANRDTYPPTDQKGVLLPSSSSLIPFLSVYIRWSTRSFVSFQRCATPSRYLFPVIQKFATHPIANGDPPSLARPFCWPIVALMLWPPTRRFLNSLSSYL